MLEVSVGFAEGFEEREAVSKMPEVAVIGIVGTPIMPVLIILDTVLF